MCYYYFMQYLFSIVMFILGACVGSFLCCQARRLHLAHAKKPVKNKRSICFSCKKQLKWYENLPIISWLASKGKCRSCGKKIGLAEILSELGSGLSFLGLSFTVDTITATPIEWLIFIITIIFAASLLFLAIYDGIYGELPTICLAISIIIAIVLLVINIINLTIFASAPTPITTILINILLSTLILGGLYLALYLVSKGKWVGDGDWLLALAISLALYHPWLSLIVLFLTNFLACIIMLPVVKKSKNPKIHLGPFLVSAYIIATIFTNFFSNSIINLW